MKTALFWFHGGFFGFVGFLTVVPKYMLHRRACRIFVSSVCTGAGQMPSHIKIEGYRLCAALHFTVAGAKGERGENNLIQLLVNPYLPLSTS